MNNNLVDVKSMSNEDIMKAIGQDDGSSTPSLPRLMINRNPEDDDGNRLPIGSFSIYHNDAGENIYGKPIKFRPFINTHIDSIKITTIAIKEKIDNETKSLLLGLSVMREYFTTS